MEDNEFEEVTIISHTDQAASILPQRTAERLMKEIRMEVTQKISQTENVKMGSLALKLSPTKTLLDEIKNRYLCLTVDSRGLTNLMQETHSTTLNPDIDKWFITSGAVCCSLSTSAEDQGRPSLLFCHQHPIDNATIWADRLWIFCAGRRVRALSLDCPEDCLVLHQEYDGPRESHVQCTNEALYFRNGERKLVMCPRENPMAAFALNDLDVREFYVLPEKTIAQGQYASLDREGNITRCNMTVNIGERYAKSAFHALHRSYKNMVLVAETAPTNDAACLILLRESDYLLLDILHLTPIGQACYASNLALLPARKRLEFALFTFGLKIHLLAIFNDKLCLIDSIQLDTNRLNRFAFDRRGNTWIVYGSCRSLFSIEVHFPDALKL